MRSKLRQQFIDLCSPYTHTNNMIDTIKKYKVTLLVLVFVIGGYYAFVTFGSPKVPEGILTSQSAFVDGTEAGQEIIQILEEINSIELDTGIFEDEKFNSLKNFVPEVKSEPQGRRNPFEPIGFGINIEGKIAEPNNLLNEN